MIERIKRTAWTGYDSDGKDKFEDVEIIHRTTQEERDNLKKGDKLIFFQYGEILSAEEGNVFTFERWYDLDTMDKEDSYYKMCIEPNQRELDAYKVGGYKYHQYWQASEVLSRSPFHNFSIWDVELFDPKVHTNFRLMSEAEALKDHNNFVEKYGA